MRMYHGCFFCAFWNYRQLTWYNKVYTISWWGDWNGRTHRTYERWHLWKSHVEGICRQTDGSDRSEKSLGRTRWRRRLWSDGIFIVIPWKAYSSLLERHCRQKYRSRAFWWNRINKSAGRNACRTFAWFRSRSQRGEKSVSFKISWACSK